MTLRWSPGYAAVDADFDNVSLLLHGDGTNGSTTIVDNSPTPKTVTTVGDAQISTAQSKFGGASVLFDGTGDYLSIANNAYFSFGSGDFTIEFWAYTTSATFPQTFVAKWGSTGFEEWYFGVGTSYGFYIHDGSITLALPLNSISTNQWVHLAVTRSGSDFRLFVDGTQSGSTYTSAASITTRTSEVRVGDDDFGANPPFTGYIDELRITKGVARYTGNFTPPTAAFADAQY